LNMRSTAPSTQQCVRPHISENPRVCNWLLVAAPFIKCEKHVLCKSAAWNHSPLI
jgi:hypothetical protein